MTKRKNHFPEFKTRVALDAIREKLTLAELSKKYGLHSGHISTWKRAALDNMTSAFGRRGSDPRPGVSTAEIEQLGQLVVERDFLVDASHQLLGTRGKNGEQGS